MKKFDLQTERLALRPLNDTHREALRAAIFAHPECVKTLLGDASTHEKQIECVNVWYKEYAHTWDQYGFGLWGIYRNDASRDLPNGLLGMIWLEKPGERSEGRADIGYAITPKAWGKGLITEAGRAVLTHVFDTTEIPAVDALIFGKINPASIRVIEKLGGEYVGQLPALSYVDEKEMRETHAFDLWIIETAKGDNAKAGIFDASYRSGQFAAEGIVTREEVTSNILNALNKNASVSAAPETQQMIRDAVSEGMAAPGWSQYRIDRSGFAVKPA